MRVFAIWVELTHDVAVQRLMTPMRAIMVGPLDLTTRSSASTAACHSSSCCSAFESFWIYTAASSRVTICRPRGLRGGKRWRIFCAIY
jgi:hypothetical protein